MSQALALAVLAGIVSGGLGLAPLLGSIGMLMLGYFVQLPLILAGLSLGVPAVLIATLAGFLLYVLIAGILPALIFTLVFALPSFLIVRQALLSRHEPSGVVWYPAGMILAQLTMLAIVGLAFAFFAFAGRPDGLLGVIEALMLEAFAQIAGITGQSVPDPALIKAGAAFVPALVACWWLIMAVINAVVAQAIATRGGWNRRPSPMLSELDLPFWLWPMMGAALALWLLGGAGLGLFGRSALMVLIAPFGFLGLAVIHKFANRWSYRQLGLAAVYAGIIVFSWPILAVVALGLVEDWAHLRRYM